MKRFIARFLSLGQPSDSDSARQGEKLLRTRARSYHHLSFLSCLQEAVKKPIGAIRSIAKCRIASMPFGGRVGSSGGCSAARPSPVHIQRTSLGPHGCKKTWPGRQSIDRFIPSFSGSDFRM